MKYLDLNGVKYFWSKIKTEIQKLQTMINEKAPRVHTHTKSQITDMISKVSELENDSGYLSSVPKANSSVLGGIIANAKTPSDTVPAKIGTDNILYVPTYPTTLPASDVSAWAKASTKPTYTKAEVGLGNVENKSSATIRGEITSSNVTSALGFTPLNSSIKGKASGLAELDSSGKVPASQLPSYVDDVLEYKTNTDFPKTGETGKIYVNTTTNKTYRWSGTSYVEISASLALGETSSTAYTGNKGKANADAIASIKNGTTVVPKASDAATVSGFTVGADVPSNAKFTDTVYTHPSTHAATMITQDSMHRFVTDTEKSTWNGKASTTVATTSANGLMSSTDKTKIDSIAANANNYTHPSYTAKSAGLYKVTVDASGHVSAATAVTKADITALGIPGSDTNTTYSDMKGATTSANGTHGLVPAPAAGAANRYLRSDGTWQVPPDTNTTYGVVTTSVNGLMSAADKKKLDGISSGATAVTVDSSLSSTSTNPVQNKVINNALAGKASTAAVTTSAAGLMSAADKTKLDGIASGANAYSHPSTHPATMISTDASHRFITDAERNNWNNAANKLKKCIFFK